MSELNGWGRREGEVAKKAFGSFSAFRATREKKVLKNKKRAELCEVRRASLKTSQGETQNSIITRNGKGRLHRSPFRIPGGSVKKGDGKGIGKLTKQPVD